MQPRQSRAGAFAGGWWKHWARIVVGAFLLSCAGVLAWPVQAAAQTNEAPDVALYYQSDVPADLLKAFDIVVLDPARAKPVLNDHTPRNIWYARLDAAELKQIVANPQGWFGSSLPALQKLGYVGFLLDDGVALGQADAASSQLIEQVLRDFSQHAPQIPLLLRNHLNLAQTYAAKLRAVVVDGVYHRGGLVRNGIIEQTPEALRQKVLQQARQLESKTGLPVIGLDYCPATDLDCRRQMAARLQKDGLTPYVSDPALSVVGVGALEVMPRTILMVINRPPTESLDDTSGARLYTMPLNQLGYVVDYANVNQLPANVSRDRYAGIVVAFDRPPTNSVAWRRWLLQRISEGMPVAVLGDFGFEIGPQQARALGLRPEPAVRDITSSRPRIVHEDPMVGFEARPSPDIQSLSTFRVGSHGQSLLTVEADGHKYDMVGLTSWGGFALPGYVVTSMDALHSERWVVQPMDFLRKALRLPRMPVPVVTTENGLRLLFVHVDGDGFASRAEIPGAPFSGQVLMDRILRKYPIPHTLSVITGVVAPDGLYPKLSARLEALARKLFALPEVEIGSHTFSHPFLWQVVEDHRLGLPVVLAPEDKGQEFNLPIPHYKFNLDREIGGSVRYIDSHLAPPGKKVEVLQWSGDAMPSAYAVEKSYQAGVLNINGGDTTITRDQPSWTRIAPLGLAKGPGDANFQVYAGIMNENVFTNDWTGPFYGFRQVRQTFDMTGSPVRFKPLNIYYHFYSATKPASLKALQEVYDAALSKPVLPIYTSEYVRKVLDWVHVAVARKGDQWVVRSGQALRELRWPGTEVPELVGSVGVSGYNRGPDGIYIHMGTDHAKFSMVHAQTGHVPYIAEAAGRVTDFSRRGRNMRFQFGGYYKPYVTLKDIAGCHVSIDGRAQGSRSTYRVSGTPAKPAQEHQFEVTCD